MASPCLKAGDHLDQATFHARYEATPAGTWAELIGGVVYTPPRPTLGHARTKTRILRWLSEYETSTLGVEAYATVTVLLGPESEPQPDACLLIAPAKGGQTRIEDDYIVGAPELIVEVASGMESIDLHAKRTDYERAGVKEYVVVVLRQARVLWHIKRGDQFVDLPPGDDGILRSEVFPGLWLDPAALLRHDNLRLLEVLRQGLASPEHAAFAALLASKP